MLVRASRSSVAAGTFSNSVVIAAHARGQLVERGLVGVLGSEMAVGHESGRAQRIGIEHHHAVAHRARPEREHPAELTAAEHADGGAGQDHAGSGSVSLSTRSVCAARKASSRPASAASVSARIATA